VTPHSTPLTASIIAGGRRQKTLLPYDLSPKWAKNVETQRGAALREGGDPYCATGNQQTAEAHLPLAREWGGKRREHLVARGAEDQEQSSRPGSGGQLRVKETHCALLAQFHGGVAKGVTGEERRRIFFPSLSPPFSLLGKGVYRSDKTAEPDGVLKHPHYLTNQTE